MSNGTRWRWGSKRIDFASDTEDVGEIRGFHDIVVSCNRMQPNATEQ